MATRTQLAQYVAKSIQSSDKSERDKAILIAAKWLKSNCKIRQKDYLIKDITTQLDNSGYVYVTITSAHKLDTATIDKLNNYIKHLHNAKNIEMSLKIDEDLIGGVKIETPIGILDTSIKARLAKIVEGVSL